MRKYFLALTIGALAFALTIGVGLSAAGNGGKDKDPASNGNKHDLDGPFSAKQRALKSKAIAMKLKGKIAPDAKVAKVAKGQYVKLAQEGTDRIFVVLAEFGTTRHSAYPDKTSTGAPASDALTFEGPLHNAIPQPDRSKDNSTLWQADFTRLTIRTCTSTGWRSTTSRSRRAATPSTAT